jgi:xanthine phosphoribosyltransferase
MHQLRDRILSDGIIIGRDLLKVDSFLNHQLDPVMLQAIGREFAQRFASAGATKVLTIEASGIACALMTALELKVPVLFAKKSKARTQPESVFHAQVSSYTRQETVTITASRRYLAPSDRVLIIDDFLAMGEATSGLVSLVEQATATLVGVGIVVEKGYQPGGKRLRERGIPVHSLAVIEELSEAGIRFTGDVAPRPLADR